MVFCLLSLLAANERLLSFTSAETLRYDVRYGPLRLGSLELVTLAPDTVQAETCYHFQATLTSTRALSFVFEATYDIETWCLMADMVTLRSYKKTEEKRYQAEWYADYDYTRDTVRYDDGKEYPLADSARDLLTLWYYYRRLKMGPGDAAKTYAHIDRKDYRVEVRAIRKVRVRAPAGEFDCIELLPTASGPMGAVYLADDSSRVPVVIKTRVGGMVVSAYLRERNEPPDTSNQGEK